MKPFFRKAMAMLKALRMIFGLPARDIVPTQQADGEFMPASQIHAEEAGNWEPWRVAADGKPWMRRTGSPIVGIADDAELVAADDADADLDEPDDDERIEAAELFRQEKERLADLIAGKLYAADGDDFETEDDDDADDE